jgi:hypothetical protein
MPPTGSARVPRRRPHANPIQRSPDFYCLRSLSLFNAILLAPEARIERLPVNDLSFHLEASQRPFASPAASFAAFYYLLLLMLPASIYLGARLMGLNPTDKLDRTAASPSISAMAAS